MRRSQRQLFEKREVVMNPSRSPYKCEDAAKKFAMSRTAFYDIQNPCSPRFDPTFPAVKIRLGARSVAWLLDPDELQTWFESRRVNTQPTRGTAQ